MSEIAYTRELPPAVRKALPRGEYRREGIGCSGAMIRVYADSVLKVERDCDVSKNEHEMLAWLQGKLPVPELLFSHAEGGYRYLLTRKLPGEMACSGENLLNPEYTARALAEGIKLLWAVDIAGCPCKQSLDVKLPEARRLYEAGEVDADDLNPDTLGEGGFENLEKALEYLERNRPRERTRLTHGDYCLPNVFIDKGQVCGFVDLGRCGAGDYWNDVALCMRSGQYNFYGGFDIKAFYAELGVPRDELREKYFILLDEFF